jgi:polyhydroxyalkanoate synthase
MHKSVTIKPETVTVDKNAHDTAAPASSSLADIDRLLHAAQARLTGGLSPAAIHMAFQDWAIHLANAPGRRMELAQMGLRQWASLAATIWNHEPEADQAPAGKDKRFESAAWSALPFSLFKQQALLSEQWWQAATTGLRGVEPANERIVRFAMRQFLDIFSPNNLALLNPDVLTQTQRSHGQNIVRGLANSLKDLSAAHAHQPQLEDGPTLGIDLAVTPGEVIYRNDLMELIQYHATTQKVKATPILIVPAWIMKYYILDLSQTNSLIKYLVDQGFSVFCISWRNPDAGFETIGLDDYRKLGVMAALDLIVQVTGAHKIHGCGYCLGGTLLAIAAAAMADNGDHRLAGVTLLAAQTDFTEAGELQLFITEAQIALLEDIMWARGTLDGTQMAGAFQMLHANDLIWSRSIGRYFLGTEDHPNDLMAWNADATRMPSRMHSEYLRSLFLHNDLSEGRYQVNGQAVSVKDIRVPIFAVGTETDHVAPWHSVYKIHLLNDGEVTFVLTSGGHNAGIVSEPGHKHRHFRTTVRPEGGLYVGPDEWIKQAQPTDGSWWPTWSAWLGQHGGKSIVPPEIGAKAQGITPLCPAPGTYVRER